MKYYSGWEAWQIVPDYSPEEKAFDDSQPFTYIAEEKPF